MYFLLLLFVLRLVPFVILIQLHKHIERFNLVKKGFYTAITGVYFGAIYLSIPYAYKYIFGEYQLFNKYEWSFGLVWLHIVLSFVIALVYLLSIKYKSNKGCAIVFLFLSGASLAAFLTFLDFAQLLLFGDHV